MKFQDVLKNFQGLIKNEMELNHVGVFELPKDVTKICATSTGETLVYL